MLMVPWQGQALSVLREAIAANTSNPPGNELVLCKRLEGFARSAGLFVRTDITAEGRGNILISPVKEWLDPASPAFRESGKPPLLLLSHLDVVPADPGQWSFDPFSGDIIAGRISGRGSLDTKQLTIMHLSALMRLMEDGWVHSAGYDRPVVMIATSDEECGSKEGLLKLIERDKEFFTNAQVLSEGGGFPIDVQGKALYLCESGQKGAAKVKISWKKKGGGNPFFPDLSGLLEASEVIRRISRSPWVFPPPAPVLRTIRHIAGHCGYRPSEQKDTGADMAAMLSTCGLHTNTFVHTLLRAMTENTCTVTKMAGGRKNSNLSGGEEAVLYLDCRLLPGCRRKDFDAHIMKLVEGTRAEVDVLDFREGFISDFSSELFEILEKVLLGLQGDAEVVPFVSIGGSDGRFLAPFGARVYGWSPVLPDLTFDEVVKMVHGIDERLPVDSFFFGCENIYRIVRQMMHREDNS